MRQAPSLKKWRDFRRSSKQMRLRTSCAFYMCSRSFFTDLWTSPAALSINLQNKNETNILQYGPHAGSITFIYYMASSVSGQDELNRAL